MFNIAFVPGPGLDFEATPCLPQVPGAHPLHGATKEQALAFLRQQHAEQGWADELYEQGYRKQHEWGVAMLALFEQAGMPVVVPVRHGGYVVTCNVS